MADSQEMSKKNSFGFQTTICKDRSPILSFMLNAFQEDPIIAKIFRVLGKENGSAFLITRKIYKTS